MQTQYHLAWHLLEMDDVKANMDLLLSIKFLAHKIGRRFSQLEGRMGGNGCSLRQKFLDKSIQRWVARGEFARRIGKHTSSFPVCTTGSAPFIMEIDLCFAEITMLVDGPVQFVDVESKVLKVHREHELCNDVLPLTVRAVESWVEINRSLTAVNSPPMAKQREGEISEAPVSKMYSSQVLKQWENSLQYHFFYHSLDQGLCQLDFYMCVFYF